MSKIGDVFGRLTIINEANSRHHWVCICACGTKCEVMKRHLQSGKTSSCGCLHREQLANRVRTHGASETVTYARWRSMRARCMLPNSKSFPKYGAKGITVCDRWKDSFENFLSDMGECPSPSMTVERLNNSLGYSPDNCKWATRTEQNRNTSSNRMLTFRGETHCVSEWAEILNIKYRTIMTRLNKGMSAEEALGTPIRQSKPKK